MNIINPIIYQAQVRPTAPAIISPRGVIRFRQLDGLTRTFAARLSAAGIGPGDLVTISLDNSPFNIIATLALARIGAISTGNMTKRFTANAPAFAKRLGCKAVCHRPGEGSIDGIQSIVIEDSWTRVPSTNTPSPPVFSGGSTTWRLTMSSGTTGKSKTIPWTHQAFLVRTLTGNYAWPVGPGDRLLPYIYISAGFALVSYMKALCHGAAIVFPRNATPTGLIEAIDREGVTDLITSTFNFGQVVQAAPHGNGWLPGLKRIVVGGGVLPEPVRRRAATLFAGKVFSLYGATEAGPAAMGSLEDLDRHPGAAGRILPYVEFQAVDENDQPLPPGREGALRLRTPSIGNGYLDDPAATAKAFRDGWFYPGDIGSVTADGILCLAGRVDEVINVGGFKVAPDRLEDRVREMKGISDLAVTAVTDAKGNGAIAVAVVAAGAFDSEGLVKRLRSLVPTPVPIHVVPVSEIPRNVMGKVVRGELAAQIQAVLKAG